ncbi:hypothetical protein M501DRAFT_1028057 [Patellaria atrata CBS 101060]|uniref:DUF6590 domain-containing protein n=1 Tax=Patellaria atrata CBS 101060 TaxID=1346257 RepID=A0A9P4SKG7_9PEZI|nr:hypothetical protein M501DRAFT_1028057 [Patellaria atrata CBS 101060]
MMMSPQQTELTWSEEHKRYFRRIYDHATSQWVSVWVAEPAEQSGSLGQSSQTQHYQTHEQSQSPEIPRTVGTPYCTDYGYGTQPWGNPVNQNAPTAYTTVSQKSPVQYAPYSGGGYGQNPYQTVPSQPSYEPTHPRQHSESSVVVSSSSSWQPGPATGGYGATQYGSGPNQSKTMDSIRPTRDTRELDESYKVRPAEFFFPGRVFSVLFSEPAGETSADPASTRSNITTTIFNGKVYTQIRRFVVVQQKKGRGHCCAWSVTPLEILDTVTKRATLKCPASASQHAIVYSSSEPPQPLPGENGLRKEPIQIEIKDSGCTLLPTSRLNLGINYPIQHNVKVKDMGQVKKDHLHRLINSWMLENASDSAGFSRIDDIQFEEA